MGTQPRKPKGIPTGGEFDHKRRSEARSTLVDDPPSDEARLEALWHSTFDSIDRAVLTRRGITPAEYGGIVEMMDTYEIPWPPHGPKNALVALRGLGYTPQETMALLGVLHGAPVGYTGAERLREGEESCFTTLATWPDGLDVSSAADIATYLKSGERLGVLAEACRHVPEGVRGGPPKPATVIAIAQAGIDDQVAERYGSPDDWRRVERCQDAQVDPEQARRWVPLYPKVFTEAEHQGWLPHQLCDEDAESTQNRTWSANGFGPTAAESWAARGFTPFDARKLHEAAHLSPEAAEQWRRAMDPDGSSRSIYAMSIVRLREAKVPLDAAESAARSGVDIGHYDAAKLLSTSSPDDVAEWGAVLANPSGQPVNPATVLAWRDGVGCTPDRARRWRERSQQLPGDIQADLDNPTLLRFINRNIDPNEIAGDRPHPAVVATARALEIDESKLAAQAASAKNGAIEACRTAFRRRRQDPPF